MKTITIKEGEQVNLVLVSKNGTIDKIENVHMNYAWDNRPNNIDVRFKINKYEERLLE